MIPIDFDNKGLDFTHINSTIYQKLYMKNKFHRLYNNY